VWFSFFMAIFNRTGGTGEPVDVSGLQTSIEVQGKEIDELFRLEGANVAAPLVSALLQRVIALEMAVQSTVPVLSAAPQSLPDAVPVTRASSTLPDPVAARPADSTTDIYKLVNS
jgi:hypothetical protein